MALDHPGHTQLLLDPTLKVGQAAHTIHSQRQPRVTWLQHLVTTTGGRLPPPLWPHAYAAAAAAAAAVTSVQTYCGLWDHRRLSHIHCVPIPTLACANHIHRVLLDAGANPDLPDHLGHPPLDYVLFHECVAEQLGMLRLLYPVRYDSVCSCQWWLRHASRPPFMLGQQRRVLALEHLSARAHLGCCLCSGRI
jgi:hypothetical protein